MENEPKKDGWDIFRIVMEVFTSITVPLAIVLAGYFIQSAIAEKDVSAQLVSLSAKILSEEPTKNKIYLRMWAARVIRKHSDVPLGDKAASILIYNENFAGFVLGDGSDKDLGSHQVRGPDTPSDPDEKQDPDAVWSGRPYFKNISDDK